MTKSHGNWFDMNVICHYTQNLDTEMFRRHRAETLTVFQQNNGVTFCSYLPCLLQSSLSPLLLLCSRLSTLWECISACRLWCPCVDLALVQEVSMLSPMFLFTHAQYTTVVESLLKRLNSLSLCHTVTILCPIFFSVSELQHVAKSSHFVQRNTSASLFDSTKCVYVWVEEGESDRERERHNDNAAYSDNILRH